MHQRGQPEYEPTRGSIFKERFGISQRTANKIRKLTETSIVAKDDSEDESIEAALKYLTVKRKERKKAETTARQKKHLASRTYKMANHKTGSSKGRRVEVIKKGRG